jgi:hypothetical protein
MQSLTEFVVARGKVGNVVPEGMAYFGIPAENLRFHHMTAVSESGRKKSVQVRRRRDTGHVDIFFVDLRPDGKAGYFYLTSTHGQLIKAAYLDPVPQPVDDAIERFEQEKEFWRLWQREKIKAASTR